MAANTTSPAAPSSPGGMSLSLLPIVLLSVALAVGLPGNSFVVWSILKRMQKRTVTALLVLNLALADLAVLLTAPFFLHFLARGTWSFREMGCRLCHYVCGISMYASVLLITIMSLDRSLAVAFLSSSVNPVLYACAGGGLLRSAGVGFVVKLLEGTGSEVSSTRRGGTLVQTPKDTPACPEPGPTDSFMTSSTIPESSK